MTEPKAIWPTNGSDPVVHVTDDVFSTVKAAVVEAGILPDTAWEIARVAIRADRKAREKRDRHERGDFALEIDEAIEAATEVYDRTDAEACDAAGNIRDLLTHAKHKGFDSFTVQEMLNNQGNLENELSRTTEFAVELHRLILVLKGVSS